ncbi:MAG: methyltransferase domain-containing protein [Rhodospirillaceae bacterium]|nr:methyltransferase domain-containing protein [Rhodospirillaceae bacterium]
MSAPAMAAAPSMDAATEAKLKTLLAGPQRSDANKARDVYRHPLETLKAFGLRQDMAVMEVWPGGGWWTEFLAPLLAEKGKYVAAHFDPSAPGDYYQKAIAGFKEKLSKDTASYGKVELTALSAATGKVEPVKPGSMDMVLTFRNLHNWMGNDSSKAMIDAMYKSLKPGGYLGVEEHRASTAAPQDPKAASGYVREDYAVKMFEDAGFKLVSKSEANANAKDTKDYPGGVWTLPPSLRLGEKDRAKYVAIGESDRMTLLFQKP